MTALSIRFGDSAPLDLLLSIIPSLPRATLDRLTAKMIDRLDELDGDLDVEPNGDELDGTAGEDDFLDNTDFAAGDPIDAEDDDADSCPAGDDGIMSGPAFGWASFQRPDLWHVGSDDDAEPDDLIH